MTDTRSLTTGKALQFDYTSVSKQWNTSLITSDLLQRFERVTGKKAHRLMRRGLFFSHRDFDKILDTYERGDPFFIYTGRGPSSNSMHIGHTIPFQFTKFLSDAFDVPLVIMLTDDEKFLFNEKGLSVEEAEQYATENAIDIIAMGFDPKKTFIFSDFKYMTSHFYRNVVEFSKLLPQNQVRGAFGFDGTQNVGRHFFPAVQCAAAFATSYPELFGDSQEAPRSAQTAKIQCLIPMAIDQDPYFRLLRDNQHRMRNPSPKTALIHSQFLTALQGPGGKMSASDPTTAIFTSDTPKDIKNKINKYAFSGGQDTLEKHRELGGNPDVDVPFQYLTYFLEDDDELMRIETGYRKGEILTGELKKLCIDLLTEEMGSFQQRRAEVTDEVLQQFMTPRKLEFKGNPNPRKPEIQVNGHTSEPHRAKQQRPGLPARTTTYGITGLSKYGALAEDLLYGDGTEDQRLERSQSRQ